MFAKSSKKIKQLLNDVNETALAGLPKLFAEFLAFTVITQLFYYHNDLFIVAPTLACFAEIRNIFTSIHTHTHTDVLQ